MDTKDIEEVFRKLQLELTHEFVKVTKQFEEIGTRVATLTKLSQDQGQGLSALKRLSEDQGQDLSALKKLSEEQRYWSEQISARLNNVEDKLDRQERRISAIEAFPVPYGRPRTFHAATELHSVSQPIRRKQSHYG